MYKSHPPSTLEIADCDHAEAEQYDPRAQLRTVYMLLLSEQSRFDEFKYLLALYPPDVGQLDQESPEAAEVRARLNTRISSWLGAPFDGLSATQMLMWRQIVVSERFNVALSPWREANSY